MSETSLCNILIFLWIILPLGVVVEIKQEAKAYLKDKGARKGISLFPTALSVFTGVMIAINWRAGVGSVWIGILAFILIIFIMVKFSLYTHFPARNQPAP